MGRDLYFTFCPAPPGGGDYFDSGKQEGKNKIKNMKERKKFNLKKEF